MDLTDLWSKRVFNDTSSFNWFWNTKILSEWTKFNGVYSRYNLSKVRDGAYVINFDEYSDVGTHWIALHVVNNGLTYIDSFGVEHIPNEIKTFIKNKIIKTNIFRTQAYNSIMCGYLCRKDFNRFY